MNPWWKIGLFLAFLAVYGATVWHVKAKFDEAAQAKALEAQIEETAKNGQSMTIRLPAALKVRDASRARETHGARENGVVSF